MKRILCWFGFHKWHYIGMEGDFRQCERCHKLQKRSPDDPYVPDRW